VKLGRTAEERKALLSSMAANLITEHRIQTTIAKAKQTRVLAEKLVTTAKKGLASAKGEGLMTAKRKALAVLRHRKHVSRLFEVIAPQYKDRMGGYTRITKLGRRGSDGSEMVLLEWVGIAPAARRKAAKPAEEKPANDETKA
jgi:large subunit ribosomal protein L17